MEKQTFVIVAQSLIPEWLKMFRNMVYLVLVARTAPADPDLYDVFLEVDHYDEEAVIAAVRAYRETNPVHGVCSLHEGSIHVAARVSEALGLPGNPYEAAKMMRDKYLTAVALERAQVPAPRFAQVTSEEEALAAAERIGYPVVVKPRGSAASQAVIKVSSPAELPEAFRVVERVQKTPVFRQGDATMPNMCYVFYASAGTGVLVQEYLPGVEVAVDLIYGNDEYRLLAIHDKPQVWDEPYFLERCYVTPPGLAPAVQEQVVAVATAALKAVGVRTGAAHVELRVTPEGPKIIEINGRLGGAYTQESIRASTGVWGPDWYIRAMLGETPSFTIDERKPAGFVSIVLDRPGVITAIEGVEEVKAMPGVLGVRTWLKPGDRVFIQYPENPNVFVAHVLATGESREELLATLHRVEATMRAVVEETNHAAV